MKAAGVRAGDRVKTKNSCFINGLASFYRALDCAAANNRLKRRDDNIEPGPIQVLPENGPQTSVSRPFS
jgi:hypothetical protein